MCDNGDDVLDEEDPGKLPPYASIAPIWARAACEGWDDEEGVEEGYD